jgi:hypothetical protein
MAHVLPRMSSWRAVNRQDRPRTFEMQVKSGVYSFCKLLKQKQAEGGLISRSLLHPIAESLFRGWCVINTPWSRIFACPWARHRGAHHQRRRRALAFVMRRQLARYLSALSWVVPAACGNCTEVSNSQYETLKSPLPWNEGPGAAQCLGTPIRPTSIQAMQKNQPL